MSEVDSAPIRYHVDVDRPRAHRVTIEASFPIDRASAASEASALIVRIPAWIPGSYLIREFARYVGEPTARDERGQERSVRKLEKGAWKVDVQGARHVTVRYEAYCNELTVRTPHVDDTHAFFTGANLLLYCERFRERRCEISFDAPAGWEVFTPLRAVDDAWIAADYDEIADTPFEVGPHPSFEFEAAGTPHRVVLWGEDAVDIDREKLTRDMRAIVERNARLFGGLPYENFLFNVQITPSGRGGIEHVSSTTIAAPWKAFRSEEGYRDLLGLIAHEHLHVWNGKRFRPAAFARYGYEAEQYTTGLWLQEGATSYLDDLQCVRAGVVELSSYLEKLGGGIGRFLATPGRQVQSLADASFDAWIRLYRRDENSVNRTVSYYLGGALAVLALDLRIRDATDGERSFDDVMRTLYERFRAGEEVWPEDRFPSIARLATGIDLSEEITDWIFGRVDPPWGTLLATHGVSYESEPVPGGWLGLSDREEAGKRYIDEVFDDGPAADAALYAGDELLAIDGEDARDEGVEAAESRLTPGRNVELLVMRRRRAHRVEITTGTRRESVTLSVDEGADDRAARLRRSWLEPSQVGSA